MHRKKTLQPPELRALEAAVRGDGPFDDEAAKDQVRLIFFGSREGLTRPGSRSVQVQDAEHWRAVAIEMVRRRWDFSQMQPESAGGYADALAGTEKITDCAFRDAMICTAVEQLTSKTWLFKLSESRVFRIISIVLSEQGIHMEKDAIKKVWDRRQLGRDN